MIKEIKPNLVIPSRTDIIPFWKPWGSGAEFCQWYPSKFTDEDGTEFSCAEQYMMYQKALLFKDLEISKAILLEKDPKVMRELGRKISGFSQEVWDKYKYGIVYQGNLLKFSQDLTLKGILLGTSGKTLVEASPYDGIWGIKGTSRDAMNPDLWKGQNLLGFALMQVRNELICSNI